MKERQCDLVWLWSSGVAIMPGDTCVVCGNTQAKDKSVSIHHFPQDKAKWQRWNEALGLQDVVTKDHHHVWSRHFTNTDAWNDFVSPKKQWTGRAKRTKKREEHRRDAATTLQLSPFSSQSLTPTASTRVTPYTSSRTNGEHQGLSAIAIWLYTWLK